MWRAGAIASVRIGGGADGAFVFGRVRGGVERGDGTIWIIDDLFHQIHVFDSTGRHQASWGREGEGPGEFETPLDLVVGETGSIASWDPGNRRVDIWADPRENVDDVPFRGITGAVRLESWSARSVSVIFRQADGTIPRDRHRDTTRFFFLRGHLRNGTLDTIISLPYGEFVRLQHYPRGRGGVIYPLPFGGSGLGTATPNTLYYTNPTSATVYGYDLTGDPTFETRLELPRSDVSEADIRRWRAEQRVFFGNNGSEADYFIRVVEDEIGYATSHPFFVRAASDQDGNGWFLRWSPHGSSSQAWWVFSPTGELVARLSMSAADALLYAGRNHMLTVRLDELDRPTVLRLAIDRSGDGYDGSTVRR
jgi:hypothetical protein